MVATPGQYKVRFIHGVGTVKSFSLDFYIDTVTAISGLTPSYPGLGYGSASLYVPIDTALHRLRITRNGLTTILLDTTFTTPPTSGSVVTIVATNVQGGGTALLATIVADTIP